MKPHQQAEDVGSLCGPSRRSRLDACVHLLYCQQCGITLLFFCSKIDFHMFIFIPECNYFIFLNAKYIKIYLLHPLRFWAPPVFFFFPNFFFSVSQVYWEKVAVLHFACWCGFTMTCFHMAGLVQGGWFVPDWASVSERKADWVTDVIQSHKSEMKTSGFSRQHVQKRAVCHQLTLILPAWVFI